MKTIVLILLSTVSIASAQTVISLQGGVNSRTALLTLKENSYKDNYWKSAYSGSVGIEHFLFKAVSVGSSLEYDSYPFDTYQDAITRPEMSLITSSGEPTQIYRISVEVKAIPPAHGRFSLYLITGASYSIEQLGQINITTTYNHGPEASRVIPSQMDYYWMHNFGLGSRYSLSDDVAIDLTGKWYSNYKNHFHESLLIGLIYIL